MINDEEKLKGVFNLFDVDNSNKISIDNMVLTFSKFGREITRNEIKKAMDAHDDNHEEQIDFEEFKKMMIE